MKNLFKFIIPLILVSANFYVIVVGFSQYDGSKSSRNWVIAIILLVLVWFSIGLGYWGSGMYLSKISEKWRSEYVGTFILTLQAIGGGIAIGISYPVMFVLVTTALIPKLQGKEINLGLGIGILVLVNYIMGTYLLFKWYKEDKFDKS